MIESLKYLNIRYKIVPLLLIVLSASSAVFISTLALKSHQQTKSEAEGQKFLPYIKAGSGSLVADNLILPSIQGFQTSLFTGDANISYGFDLPKGAGGLTPALGLSYSSSSVADMGVGLGKTKEKTNNRYYSQAGPVGFGWNLTGVGSIEKVRDSQDNNEIQYYLNLGGASYKLISLDGNLWETSPKSYFKIKHSNCSNSGIANDTPQWEVTDTSGAFYVFGATVGSDCTLATAANQHLSTAWRFKNHKKNGYSELEPYKWMLRYVRDIHGNAINYSYTQEWGRQNDQNKIKSVFYCQDTKVNHYPKNLVNSISTDGFYNYTSAVKIDQITYGSSKEFIVKFNYEPRNDWKMLEYNNNCQQNYYSTERIDEIQILNNNKIYALYDLSYAYFDQKFSDADGNQQGHLTLTSINQRGKNNKGTLPAYTFSYGGEAPNQVLLTTANNGYGGTVTYNYDGQSYKRCSLVNVCHQDVNADQRITVKSKTINDATTGNSYAVVYDYSGGLAKYDRFDLDGSCNGVDFVGSPADCQSFDGFEFLGYNSVTEKMGKNGATDLSKTQDIARMSRTSFYQEIKSSDCFNPSVKKGKASLVQIFNPKTQTELSSSQTNYKTIGLPEPACQRDRTAYLNQQFPQTMPSDSTSTVDGITTRTEYDYDQYGNATLVANLGFKNNKDNWINGDEKYTLTSFNVNLTNNIIGKPYKTIVSSDRAGKSILSISKMYYDGSKNLTDPPQKGNLTQLTTGSKNAKPVLNLEEINDEKDEAASESDLEASTTASSPKNIQKATVNYEYDKYGNVVETTDPLGRKTITAYDATHTLPQTVTNPKPFKWKTNTTYDSVLLKPTKITDVNGNLTEICYDNFGRVTKVYGPSESSIKKDSCKAKNTSPVTVGATYTDGSPLRVSLETLINKAVNPPQYKKSVSFYNGLGQKVEEKEQWDNNQTRVTYTAYTSLGQMDYSYIPLLDNRSIETFLKESDINSNNTLAKTNTNYDFFGRVVAVIHPDGTKVQTDYDGTQTIIYDANDPGKTGRNKKITTVNAYGQAVKIEEYKDGKSYLVQSFTYDDLGRLQKAKDPGGHISTYDYDILGRKVREANKDSGTTSYVYDAAGNLTSKTDNKGQTIVMKYDNLNRVTKRIYPDGTTAVYKYDEGKDQKGKLTTVSSELGIKTTTQYTYDIKGRLLQEEKTIAGDSPQVTKYTYDDADRIKTITYPDNEIVTQTYTDSSLPATLTSSLGINLIQSSVYNINGQLINRAFGNTTTLTQNYDPASFRLTDIIVSSANTAQSSSGGGTVAGTLNER